MAQWLVRYCVNRYLTASEAVVVPNSALSAGEPQPDVLALQQSELAVSSERYCR